MKSWINPYNSEGNWYRGNTHLHTFHGPYDSIRTNTLDIIKWYRDQGYSFLNFSDHCTITKLENPYDDFIVFSGHESDCMVGIDVPCRLNLSDADNETRLERLKVWLDDIQKQGGISQLAHPLATLKNNWRENFSYIQELGGLNLIELYNNRQGDYDGDIHWQADYKYAVDIWDAMLLDCMRVYPTAVDDSHDYFMKPTILPDNDRQIIREWRPVPKAEQFFESGGGWMCVQADELSADNIKSAIRQGAVYASQGPAFESIKLNNDILHITLPDKYQIRIIADGQHIEQTLASEYKFNMPNPENAIYIRIELADNQGKQAWSAPLFSAR